MRLKKLELYGFKSFATKTEIVFEEGITGIVGPNGSGKSNIGDAVRWVLGEQSAKTLRGASMSDVIFNGTQKRKPLSYCEVSLVFDNEDRALNLDYAEVMITRRVYRNGESDYYLNGTACRLKDVVDLFRDTGIGKEGYSIIGQGRIDEILSRKSEDRRQVFEEAAGIVKFRARKEEADRKLERTLENAARVDDILEELGRRVGPLEEQSRAAREYLAYSEELKGLELNLFLIRSDRAKARLTELNTEAEGLGAALAEAEATLNMLGAQRDEAQQRVDTLEAEVTARRDELLEAAEAVHQAQEALSAVETHIASRGESRELLRREEENAALRLRELEEARVDVGAARDQLTRRITEAEQALEAARGEAERTADEVARQDEALEAHKSAILQSMNRLSAMRNDQTRLKTMRQQMEVRLKEIEEEERSLRGGEQSLKLALGEAQDRLQAEQTRLRELEQAHSQRQSAFEAVDAELIGLRARAEKRSAELQAEQSRWKLLNEMTREMEGYSQSVRRAVQYAREQGLGGVKGVLAQLISVPQRYETAIDMALGAAQQNIVTDNEETAKRIIDYLRQNRLGRATFLPQSAIRGKLLSDRERQVLGMPGCLGVASELVTCEGQYRPIVENLLGRTVIADGLEHGIGIMRAGSHAFRLVTLEGDVMHSGGSMTGGSTQSRMVNLLGRQRELQELTEKLKSGKAEMERLRQELTDGQTRKNELRGAVAEALYASHQQEIAVARESERLERARDELEAHRQRMSDSAEAAVQLRDAMAELDDQLNDAASHGDSAELDQSAMERRTEAMQAALGEARRAARDASDLVVERTMGLADLRHELEDLRRGLTRDEEEKRRLDAAATQRAERMAAMDADDRSDAAERQRLTVEIGQRKSAQEALDARVDALEMERTAERGRLNELLREMESLRDAQTRDVDRLHRVELQRSRVETDLRVLQDRIWNTYELTYAGAEAFRAGEEFREKEADRRVAELNSAIRALGQVNVHAVEEYTETKARFDELSLQQNDLRRAEKDLRELIDRLLKEMRVTFVDSFSKLQGYFSETFARLFGGGHAELHLMDPDDPLNCGIEVNAQPPGKKLQLLSLLSGGERALTAIAILFAMLKLKPTPFCILDEIEAALDDANIGYYADYLKEYSQSTQFIVVTHRKGTMERCDSLYGVAMEEQGVSRMVSVSLQDYDA